MNFVFISPNFPDNYWLFCQGLKRLGVNVCGIGDAPYETLSEELKQNLNEYYRVDSRPYSAVFMGRKDCLSYQYSLQDIRDEFKEAVLDIRRLPSVLAEAMGDVVVLARFKTTAEVERFVAACSRLADNS